jgi:SAM-dependent methyltransferase
MQQATLFDLQPTNRTGHNALSGSFVDDLLEDRAFGVATHSMVGSVPQIMNAFWTAQQRQAHSLHEISYRACFKPQLPAFFIERLTRPSDLVYDPFMGRGTTLLEAALWGRNVAGNDINPLSAMLLAPRLSPPMVSAVSARLKDIPSLTVLPAAELEVFYHPKTLARIQSLRQWFIDRAAAGALDAVDSWIRMVALNRLTGHSVGFFSVYTMPPNQAVSVQAQAKINAKRAQIPAWRDVDAIILRKTQQLLRDGCPQRYLLPLLSCASAEHTPAIQDSSVTLIVTSPPFLDVVDYAADNWLRGWFAGIDMATLSITMLKRETDWVAFMRRVFAELYRVLKPGGHIAFEVGEVRGGKIKLDELVLAASSDMGLECLCVMINTQNFTKTANCWGVANNAKGTNSNRIVVLRKQSA